MLKTGKDWMVLITCLLICHAAGAVGSLFTVASIPLWYNTLVLPAFSPPNWVFGPVWTLLYTLMGIALYIVWRSRGGSVEKARNRKWGLSVFGIQLVLNALWSILFFGLRDPLYALVDIVLLLLFIIATIFFFYRVRPVAAYLLVPYVLWVGFATLLNYNIMVLN